MISAFALSQILAAIAFVFVLLSFQCRARRNTLLFLSVGQFVVSLHFFLLGAETAGWILLFSSFRFFVSIFTMQQWLKYTFIMCICVIGAYTFSESYDVLPIFGGILGTLGAFSPDERRMRQFFMGGTSTAIALNIIIFSPVAILSEIFFLASNMLSYWRFYIKK